MHILHPKVSFIALKQSFLHVPILPQLTSLRGASRPKINSMVGMKPLDSSVRGSSNILIYVILQMARESWNLILMFINFPLVWFLGDSCHHSIWEGKEASSSVAVNMAFITLMSCPGSHAIWGYWDLNLQNFQLKICSLHYKAVWQSHTLSSSRTLLHTYGKGAGGPFRGMWSIYCSWRNPYVTCYRTKAKVFLSSPMLSWSSKKPKKVASEHCQEVQKCVHTYTLYG